MPLINIVTRIDAPIDLCFKLSLSVDVHTQSVAATAEKAVGGVVSGIMTLHDTVTWEANHFGLRLRLTSRIAAHDPPHYFVSEMVKGPFKKLYHQHLFREEAGQTVMTDLFELQAPFGFLGRIAERSFLEAYMRKFLLMRNAYIKTLAEATFHGTVR